MKEKNKKNNYSFNKKHGYAPKYIPLFLWNNNFYKSENWYRLIAYMCWMLSLIMILIFIFFIHPDESELTPQNWTFYFLGTCSMLIPTGIFFKIKQYFVKRRRTRDSHDSSQTKLS